MNMENEKQEQEKPQTTALASVTMTERGLQPSTIEEAWRFANALSRSSFVPVEYKGNPDNCLIAIDLSQRLGIPWLMLMQHLYLVHNRPALDSAITTALVNQSGQFIDPLEYEVEGKNALDKDFRVRAYATRKSTGKVLYGPWINWQLVKAEGWDSKTGSKWKSMPDQMFHYRAASWFQRRYCPELTMGMITSEELQETAPPEPERKVVESTELEPPNKGVAGLRDKLSAQKEKEKEIEQHAADKFGSPEEVEAGKKRKAEQEGQQAAEQTTEKEKKTKKKTKKTKKTKDTNDEIKDPESHENPERQCSKGHRFTEPFISGIGDELCPKCFEKL